MQADENSKIDICQGWWTYSSRHDNVKINKVWRAHPSLPTTATASIVRPSRLPSSRSSTSAKVLNVIKKGHAKIMDTTHDTAAAIIRDQNTICPACLLESAAPCQRRTTGFSNNITGACKWVVTPHQPPRTPQQCSSAQQQRLLSQKTTALLQELSEHLIAPEFSCR